MGIFSRKPKETDESYKEFVRILEGIKIKITTLELKLDSFHTKLRGFDCKWGKFLKQMDEDNEEEERNETENSIRNSFLGNIENGRNNPLG